MVLEHSVPQAGQADEGDVLDMSHLPRRKMMAVPSIMLSAAGPTRTRNEKCVSFLGTGTDGPTVLAKRVNQTKGITHSDKRYSRWPCLALF